MISTYLGSKYEYDLNSLGLDRLIGLRKQDMSEMDLK